MKKDRYAIILFAGVILYSIIQIIIGLILNNNSKLIINLITIVLFISQIIFWIGKRKIGLLLYSLSLIGYYIYIFSFKKLNIYTILIYFILEIYCIYILTKNK